MVTCKKCKIKIGMFANKIVCEECDSTYCEKCSTEIVECEYCNVDYCKKCLEKHTPDCKLENETTPAEEAEDEEETCDDCGEVLSDCTCEEEMPDGLYFNKDKTICIINIADNELNCFIEQLVTLRKDFVLDKELSTLTNNRELVWIKKV